MARAQVGRELVDRHRRHDPRQVDQASDVVLDGGVGDVVRCLAVLGDEVAAPHAVDEVVDRLGTLDGGHHLPGVHDVHDGDVDVAGPREALRGLRSGEGGRDLVPALEERGDQPSADVPAGASDEHTHA